MNTAIIVAAGSGERFSASRPKQFVDLLGKPLIVHTLAKFESCPEIDDIVLVLSEAGKAEFEISNFGLDITKLKRIVVGGLTRAESVRNGLEAVRPDTQVAAVHDGARPLVSSVEIAATICKAAEHGAACLVAEVTDTIKEIQGEFISRTIDRGSLRRALTPQAFKYDILRRAIDGVELDEAVTDECMLVERLGIRVAYVEGSTRNIKITRPDDLLFAASILKGEIS